MKAACIYRIDQRSSKAFLKQMECFVNEAKVAGVQLDVVSSIDALDYVNDNFRPLEFVFFLNRDLYNASAIEGMGLKVYNGVETMIVGDDKALQYLHFVSDKLPIPRFYPSPDVGTASYDSCLEYIQDDLKQLGITYPLIIRGRQLYDHEEKIISNGLALFNFLKEAKKPFIIQEFISSPHYLGYVVGHKCFAIVEMSYHVDPISQKKDGDYLLSLSNKDNRFTRALCVEAIDSLGFDYGVVEFVMLNGKPVLYGVNPFMRTLATESLTHKPLTNYLINYMKDNYKKKKVRATAKTRDKQNKMQYAIDILRTHNRKQKVKEEDE